MVDTINFGRLEQLESELNVNQIQLNHMKILMISSLILKLCSVMLQLKDNLRISQEQSQSYENELVQIFNTVSTSSV